MPRGLSVAEPDRKVPCLRRHVGGHYFVRLPGGRGSKWFGRDPARAQSLFADWCREFARLTAAGHAKILSDPKTGRIRTMVVGTSTVIECSLTVQQIADLLFALVDVEAGPEGQKGARARLVRFLALFGSRPIISLTPADLLSFRGTIATLSRDTQADYLTSVRRLLTFAWENGYVDQPFRLGVLRNPRRGPLPVKYVPPDRIRTLLGLVASRNPNLARTMLLQFLCVMRPSEVSNVVHQRGTWEEEGVYAIVGKTTAKTGEMRRVLLTPDALGLLATIDRNAIPTPNAYRLACNQVGGFYGPATVRSLIYKPTLSPHLLRHSAANALVRTDAREEHIRAAKGRTLPRVDRTYRGENYQAARRGIAVLSELVPLSCIDPKAESGGPVAMAVEGIL